MSPSILRLLDASANRAREALRVLEDYARFVLDDRAMSAELKQLRHELADAAGPLLAEAIVHRDTPGDVGVANKADGELHRSSLADVIVAAGKRLGEALRSIEEYVKTSSPGAAQRIERARYDFYVLEQRLAATLSRPTLQFERVRLYVLITERFCRLPWFQTAELALKGGADCLQLREKELESGELLRRARALHDLCKRYGALLIINDRPDIAALSGADGVHVGQSDLPVHEARKIVGTGRIVGVSTHNLEQAMAAQATGADYVGIGPSFPSPTKPRDFVVGPALAGEITRRLHLPVIAIAGICAANLDELLLAGVDRVAVTAAVVNQSDVEGAARSLKERMPRNLPSITAAASSR